MWRALFEFLAAIAKPLSQLWQRKIERDKSPDEIRRKQSEEIAREIIRDDAESANRRVGDWLQKIRRRSRKQSDSPSQGGPPVRS
jgi:hypothetical protein